MTLVDQTSRPEAGDHTRFVPVCRLERLPTDRGVAALVEGVAVAVFRLSDGSLHAVDNVDPFSGASVLSRGLVGEVAGEPTVAAPLYKQRFSLVDGRCLDDDAVTVRVHEVRALEGHVAVRLVA